jgi:hypothetical protein
MTERHIQIAVAWADIIICSAAWLLVLVPPVLAVVFAVIVIRKRGRR